ncbi:GNAT family N-acetyltransferase [Paracoccus sp. JM45]|uniref:GNAT family N-acetyltransferase n=1 Tax=Paracoccus sp. JM45 TaxID=2283626 RepID=UPI000E6C9AA9|nr:GNAT family N-acetyltransferase [Paracoccus sp. JM45]RJE80548.1 GNAT family N-acetyltransferase [Paracoccus sp. JM45]
MNCPDRLADLHARCFTTPRPWSASEFASLIMTKGVFLLEENGGFLLGRAIAGEAELLTIAVDPERQRGGIGRHLVARFSSTARDMDATDAFLEVASDNHAAKALYLATGWLEAGVRRGYYGPRTDAIVMRLTLRSGQ